MVITRCPDCHARFRVTDGQLKLARGQVRCGACLCVFDARVHALPDTAAPEPSEGKPTQNAAQSKPVTSPASTPTEVESRAQFDEKSAQPEPVRAPEPQAEPPAAATPPVNAASSSPLSPAIAVAAAPKPEAAASNMPFSAEPIAFNRRDRDDSPFVTTGWLLLSCLAALALVAQLLWFERARLAEYPELGSIYALLCEQVDCSLTQNALSLIDNQGLHLQPHPKFSDALNATILLENQAAFSQPWPGLLLRFTDLKGRLVAQRTFQPEEYLDTSTIDPLHMPTSQPMQIELELASPGRRGVSYELKLTPAILASAK